MALNLHSLCSGLERVFELIALELDGGALRGEAWAALPLKVTEYVLGVKTPWFGMTTTSSTR